MTFLKHFFVLIITTLSLSCSSNYLELNMTTKEKAESVLRAMIDDSDTPGLQYIIVNKDSTIFEYSGGFSDLEHKIKMTPEVTFNAFSVTKTFTALAVLQLEEEGKLNLDDLASKYLKFIPYKTDFTISQLLNHTAGIPNPIPINWIHLYSERAKFNYSEFVQKVLKDNDEVDYEPGEKYSYSNIGYLLLGEVIQKVSGEEYVDYVMNKIIKKIQLNDNAYLGFEIQDTLNQARGYIKKWSFLNFGLNFIFDKSKYMDDSYCGWSQFKYFYLNGYSFGGLIGNARGLVKYLQLLLKDNTLITNEKKIKLFEDQKTKDGKIIDVCLSWFKGNLDGQIYYTHAGGGGGYYCEIRLYPQKKMASVIMLNRTGISDDRLLDSIDKIFYEQSLYP